MHSAAAQQQKPPNQPQPGKQSNHGTVTKLLENFGFIDDSIFFPLSAVNGAGVKVGDKVYYECTYSQNLPFKWNATLVRMVPSPGSAGGQFDSHNAPSKQQPQPPPANQPPHPQYQQHHHAPPPHHHQPPPHQQQQPQPGNYSIPPPNIYQPNAPAGPNSAPQPNSNYYQPPPQPQTKLPPPFGNSSYNSYSGPPPGVPPQQQQPTPVQQPPPQQSQPPPQQQQPQQAPFPDFAKVQQAVAAAAQLAQYYPPQGQPGNPSQPPAGVTGSSNSNRPAAPPQSVHNNVPNSSHGLPPPQSTVAGSNASNAPTQYGQLQYTSTPGSAFISTPPQFPAHGGGSKMGGPPPQHQGRGGPPNGPGGPMGRNWDPRDQDRFDPRRQPGGPGPRDDPRGPGSRFGPPPPDMGGPPPRGPGPNGPSGPPPSQQHKNRFNDNDRFGPPPPSSMNEDRFNSSNFGQPEQPRFGRQPPPQQQQQPPSVGRDEFGREARKDSDARFRDRDSRDNANKETFRDRDKRDNRDKDHRDHSREKGREVSRDRDRRERPDFKSRSSKRSISPVNSVSSSQGHSTRSVPNSGIPSKRRFEPCNLPKSTILRNRFNSNDLKSRISGSIHVPSDLKEVFYNVDMDLDLLDIPKPILFKITPVVENSKNKEKESKNKDKDVSKSSKPADSKPSSKEEAKVDKVSSKSLDSEIKPSSTEVSKKTADDSVEDKKENTTSTVATVAADVENSEKSEEKKECPETVVNKEETVESKEMEVDEDSKNDEVTKPDTTNKANTEVMESSIDTDKPESDNNKDADKKNIVEEQQLPSQTEALASQTSSTKMEVSTTTSTTTATKSHKYNVKVLLISLPILSEIYDQIFGADFDGVGSSKSRNTHFNKIFSLLVTRNSNDGYSLIGGKFVPEMDGYLSEGTEPNLVATAIRVVYENTGLNLCACRQWKVFSTFIYNRDTNLDPQHGGYEITKIYMPDIWSSFESIYSPYRSLLGDSVVEISNEKSEAVLEEVKVEPGKSSKDLKPNLQSKVNKVVEEQSQPMEVESVPKKDTTTNDKTENVETENDNLLNPCNNKDYLQNIMRNMNEMKVADLKMELEKLGIKLETRMRKDQLAQRLREHVESMLINLSNPPIAENEADKTIDCTIDRTVPELVIDSSMISENGDEPTESVELKEQSAAVVNPPSEEGATKRKLSTTEEVASVSVEISEKKLTEDNVETSAKKVKLNDSIKSDEPASMLATASNIKVKGNLSTLSLSAALNPHRFDQFELVIVAELLRDSLVAHFSRYIFTSLIYNNQLLKTPSAPAEKHRIIPVNYIHLAFSFFDKNHCGYINLDDLTNLLNATGYPLSKKVANSLVSSTSDPKIVYRDFQPPTIDLIERTPQYPSVGISSSLPSVSSSTSSNNLLNSSSSTGPLIIERNCAQYNVDELIKQSEADQKIKVRLNETLANSTNKNAQLEQIITELETKQKKMSAATGRQNDELCSIKRERDQLKSKYDQLRRAIEKSQSLFADVLRQHQPAPVPQTNTTPAVQAPVSTETKSATAPVVTSSKTD